MLEYGFYNSVSGDRRYNATQMSEIFEGLITDGIYPSVGDKFATTPGEGLQVIVGTGRAWFNGTWSRNKSKQPITLSIPDPVFERIDTVCLKIDKSDAVRANSITLVRGTVATSPKPATLPTATDVFYHPLAYVRVRAAASAITAADIEILVGKSSCPFTTSVLQQTNIDVLFAQWDKQFHDWWDSLKLILEGDVAANLIGSIDQINTKINTINTNITNLNNNKVNKVDKATLTNVTVSGNDNFWVPASVVRSLYGELRGFGWDKQGIFVFRNSGNFVAPATGKAYVIAVGGGGGGGGAIIFNWHTSMVGFRAGGGGGGSGYISAGYVDVTKGSTYRVIVGRGGSGTNTTVDIAGYSSTRPTMEAGDGGVGGHSVFGNIEASGGIGGKGGKITITESGGTYSISSQSYPFGGAGFCGGGGGSLRTRRNYTVSTDANTSSTGTATSVSGGAGDTVTIFGVDIVGGAGDSSTGGSNGGIGGSSFLGRQAYSSELESHAGGGAGVFGDQSKILRFRYISSIEGYNPNTIYVDERRLTFTDITYSRGTSFGFGGMGMSYQALERYGYSGQSYSEAGGDGCVILFFPTE